MRFLLYCSQVVFFLCLFFIGTNKAAYAQDSLGNKKPKVEYWKKDAFKDYPTDSFQLKRRHNSDEFKNIRKKYAGNEFNYQENKRDRLSFIEKLSRRINQFFNNLFPNWSANTNKAVIYLLILLGIFALAFLIYKIVFSGNKVWLKEKKETVEGEAAFLEKNLERIDLAQYIEKAIEADEFELAIRYLHLQNLQALAKKGLINWDYRKTNADFLKEIKQEEIKLGFQETTTLFNYIWFGKFEIDVVKFEQYKNDFINFKKQIER